MISRDRGIPKGFLPILLPASLGGGLWEALGLPLGWLMGAAVVAGGFAMANVAVSVPKPLYSVSLCALGASVGLAITPDVAATMVLWAPVMGIAAFLGIAAAALMAPVLAHFGHMERSTAFFSLLPGGVIEMANVGEAYGAERTIVSALHAMRVALVVGLLPLALFSVLPAHDASPTDGPLLGWSGLAIALLVGFAGGWAADKAGLPAAWLLGALISVGAVSSTGVLSGRIPEALLAIVQIFVGISLGARFQRARLASIPRALTVGLPVLLFIMGLMAAASALTSLVTPFPFATLVLCFSIGGMAEMVLTSKALAQNVALVAAFQAVRAVIVNACAGAVWRHWASQTHPNNPPKG
ncbi:AbrB family transcriptional regulator [Pacificoceanicola onchidii]|uniref:AbrB family transcriptional regulator n=1 Tax=Pacificoceanicola onchidii TaxID=2562685 RepID=UPI001455EA20|nr:AbrB family transcriptional regulator [Pacificoceanicola onchidii]